jgi:5-methylcytosine-specific restriction endonuclease McrA
MRSKKGLTNSVFDQAPTKKKNRPKKNKMPKLVRQTVLDRDRSICSYCGRGQAESPSGPMDYLHVHHILYLSEGGKHEAQNLITLCHLCHALVHSDKKKWQKVLLTYIERFDTTGSRPSVASIYRELNPEEGL